MILAGNLIKTAVQDAFKEGKVDENGRPLIEYVVRQALDLPLHALNEGEKQRLDEQIDWWWRRVK